MLAAPLASSRIVDAVDHSTAVMFAMCALVRGDRARACRLQTGRAAAASVFLFIGID
ncbi:MAG TPA: hypothetical protein VF446_17485 [Trinickia sp.]